MKTATVVCDALGLPFASTGQFAVVFKVTLNGGPAAVRCFTRPLGDLEVRYQLINDHLNKASSLAPALLNRFVRFEFDTGGILVRGQWYPILQMEWVNGNTLDVALDQLVRNNSKAEIRTLAEEFNRLVCDLRGCLIGHGDLQHGNILVLPDLSFKLVDLDGMFVPAMKGRKAAELGHRDYQHPLRTETFFDERIDNFSILVIYLSLLALADDPSLWNVFRKESLIFSQEDFKNPKSSRVFAQLRSKQGEIRALVAALEDACKRTPEDCPFLSTLVATAPLPASNLPAWMRPDSSSITVTTRAASPGGVPVASGKTPTAVVSSTSGTTVRVSVPIGQSGATQGKRYSNLLAGCYAAIGSFLFLAVTQAAHSLLYFYCAIGFFMMGVVLRHTSRISPTLTKVSSSPRGSSTQTTSQASYSPQPAQQYTASSSSALYVGSKSRLTFHQASCEWAQRVSVRNRVTFASAADARSRGYRPCRLCKP